MGEAQDRKGNWCETYTGQKFWTLDPSPYEITIVDIAHALSHICRYGGHSKHFYSVAQHSIIVSQQIKKDGYNYLAQLYGLMHDAAEAYICDLPRPIKICLEQYSKFEKAIQKAVYEKIGIRAPDHFQQQIIDRIDKLVMYNEAIELMHNHITDNFDAPKIKLDIDVSYRDMQEVKKEFIQLYNYLFIKIKD